MITLKALELFGFKSFADRTRFEFPAGITVVVGPNGSGKSNVVDAIKWVLGEQSVRSLRAKESTDVIFAGSTARKSLNAAEVSLVFDNSSRELPVEADEVRIMRRVYRSGESEYLINDGISRLRDIREVLSGTGAATDSYSVIEQGRVDALLVASGKERRAVFEEAAGITKFRSRRAEALRRLDRTEQNRQRLADIAGEVASRLETVKAQASRARRWRRMTDRLQAFRFAAAATDLVEVNATLEQLAVTEALATEQTGAAEAEQAAATSRLESLQQDEQQLEPGLAAARQQLTLARERAAAAEARCDSLRSRRADIEAEAAAAAAGIASTRRQVQAAAAALAATRQEQAAAVSEAEQLTAELSRHEQAAAGSRQDIAAAERELADLRRQLDREMFDHQQAESAAKQRQAEAEAALEEVESCRDELEAAWALVRQTEERMASAEGTIAALQRRGEDLAGRQHRLDITQRQRATEVDQAWQDLAERKARLEASRDRQALLQDLIARHEGLSEATRVLLEQATEIPGLLGLPADLIVADGEWAELVDIAIGILGGRLVVDRLAGMLEWHTGWSASEAAAAVQAAGGRVGFLAVDGLDEPPALELNAAGVIGRLDRLVAAALPDSGVTDASAAAEPTAASGGAEAATDDVGASGRSPLANRLQRCLLGRAWVVDSLQTARRLLPGLPAGLMLLTQSGSWLSSDGGFEIGSTGGGTGLVSRHSELRAVETQHQALEAAVAEATRQVQSRQRQLEECRDEQKRLVARQQELAETIATSRSERDRFERELRGGKTQVEAGQKRLHDAEAAAVAAADAVRCATATRTERQATLATTTQRIDERESSLAAIDRSREQVLEDVERLRRQHAACRERAAALEATLTARQNEERGRQEELAAAIDRGTAITHRLATVDLDRLAAGDQFAESALAAEHASNELAELSSRQAAISTARQEAATRLESARQTMSRCAETGHAAALQREAAQHQRTRVLERLQDDYGIDPTAALPAPATTDFEGEPIDLPAEREQLDAAIEELRRKLSSIGSVNLEALAEAEALASRLAELEGQLADVTAAKQSVEQLIGRIDEQSRTLLGETIEKVRVEFRELFERLFGGGQADIVLDPEMDLLETTVEIVARPPGKEPRNITLLSGGEKTMTCVALLLAIFRSRPSPFCVLDEVDAALDEANVDRFVGVLRDFLSSTQFIVVTHSKKTMATATTLYGVTMEESGVSKRVAVKFEATGSSAQSKAA